MPYQNPHAKVRKICPICGKEFVTVAHYNQVYDTVQCYRRAKLVRRLERTTPKIETKVEEQRNELIEAEIYFTQARSPSVEQLDKFAQLILLNLNDNKPIKLLGSVPDWKPPRGVALVEQQGTDQKIWLLVAREPSPLDALLGI